MRRARGEQGDIVLGWLTRLTAVLSLFGLMAFDGVALTVSRFQAADHATTAATAAADAYEGRHSVQAAYDAGLAAVVTSGDTIETTSFRVATDGRVTLTLHHTATTLLVHRVHWLRPYVDARASGTARPAS